jgi:hypothetical protein
MEVEGTFSSNTTSALAVQRRLVPLTLQTSDDKFKKENDAIFAMAPFSFLNLELTGSNAIF